MYLFHCWPLGGEAARLELQWEWSKAVAQAPFGSPRLPEHNFLSPLHTHRWVVGFLTQSPEPSRFGLGCSQLFDDIAARHQSVRGRT